MLGCACYPQITCDDDDMELAEGEVICVSDSPELQMAQSKEWDHFPMNSMVIFHGKVSLPESNMEMRL